MKARNSVMILAVLGLVLLAFSSTVSAIPQAQVKTLEASTKPAFIPQDNYEALMKNLPKMKACGKGVFYGYDLDGNLFVEGKYRRGFFKGMTSEDKVLRGVYGQGLITGIYDGKIFNGEYDNHFFYMNIDGKEIYGVYM